MLTYLNEEQYKDSVNFLKGRNREIKLEGQTSDRKNQDPRNCFNDTEGIKMEEEYKKMEMEKERKEKESNWETQKKTL